MCLRPGGVALFVDGDMHLVKEDMDTFQEVACDACPSGSWMQRYFHGQSAAFLLDAQPSTRLSQRRDRHR